MARSAHQVIFLHGRSNPIEVRAGDLWERLQVGLPLQNEHGHLELIPQRGQIERGERPPHIQPEEVDLREVCRLVCLPPLCFGSVFVRGFLTASLLFCVGPMTILGSIQDGLTGDYSLLAIKSMLDGFSALAFASALGVGVVFSAGVVLAYQGALTLSAAWVRPLLTEAMITEMTAVGGLLIMGIGITLLDIKRLPLANLLPAIFVAPVLVAASKALLG